MNEAKLQISFIRDDPGLVVRADDAEEMNTLIQSILPIYKRFRDAVDKGRENKATAAAQSKGLTAVCPDCGTQMIMKSGTSKTGKHWSGLFCPNAVKGNNDQHKPVWL